MVEMLNLTHKVLFIGIILFVCFALLGGCRTDTLNSNAVAQPDANTAGGTSPAQPPKSFSAADVAKLRWIEGTWRGTGENMDPRYERYTLDGDTVLVLDNFGSEKMDKPVDTLRFELKDGEFGTANTSAHWAATEITDDSATFLRFAPEKPKGEAPAGHPQMADSPRSIHWQNNKDGTWKAVIDWPPKGDQPVPQTVLLMERWPQGGQK
jgi:hypothetical protein